MAVNFRPITRATRDMSPFAWRLNAGALKVPQTYDCRNGGTTDPDPVITKKRVPPYVTFHIDGIPALAMPNQQRPIDDLKRKFYERVVTRTAATYQRDLEREIGVFEMKIPFDSLVFPTYRQKHVEVVSQARYIHFRVTWTGMNLREWVLVSMPVGDEHSIREIGQCTAQGYQRSLSLALTYFPIPLPGRDYPPKTPLGRRLTALQKRARAQSLQERIEELQRELERLNEEITELEGQ